ncbi:2-deoxyglucose-6-phosphatase [Prolixibacter bellariivorans]|uniref:2-deoxyglucose-6-phosphatase n=1 Tax=Prolixibacter bellariivorans TaxID=314319 RepID=A0A5M4B5V6_9BACT|nr:hexitol phosphatase HxpB [Prolixibacter bellariivorans]GET35208.1 2-deoxyglucose-6-phosphatase [Prolixibacter bellariivorans]
MKQKIEAVIFDMDGVIIDSEAIWKRAEQEVFSSVGVELSSELCELTQAMTTAAVTRFWYERFPWKEKSLTEVEYSVIERVADLIRDEGTAIDGVERFIRDIKHRGYKIGLATNSPAMLIPVVLEKLGISDYFDAIASAEHEPEGKPNPSVYSSVIKKLGLTPATCVAIEDSLSGLVAARKAGMKTIAIVNGAHASAEFGIADLIVNHYGELDLKTENY